MKTIFNYSILQNENGLTQICIAKNAKFKKIINCYYLINNNNLIEQFNNIFYTCDLHCHKNKK